MDRAGADAVWMQNLLCIDRVCPCTLGVPYIVNAIGLTEGISRPLTETVIRGLVLKEDNGAK